MKKLLCVLFFVLILSSQAMADVAITSTNFPDYEFRNYVNMRCNTNGDKILDDSEISKITKIEAKGLGIRQLDGIEYFTYLTELDCSGNKLTTLDLRKNTALTVLDCSNNDLTELDISTCTELKSINCISNKLTELDVGNCSYLKSLNCSDNQLIKLDVSYNDALTFLNCGTNQLTRLYVSENTILTYLNCYNNQLTKLYVSENNTLESLFCGKNKLSRLYVRKNTALTILDCGHNQLTKLDLSDNVALSNLYCNNNLLTDLYVSENASLTELDCRENKLIELDVSKNTILSILKCSGNRLGDIDLSRNLALSALDCDDNQLTTIDLSKNNAIEKLSCENQKADFFIDSLTLDFNNLIPSSKVPNIVKKSVQGLTTTNTAITTTYAADTGIAEFAQFPATIRYDYPTGCGKTVLPVSLVIVTLKEPSITTSVTDAIETNTNYRFRLQASGINPIKWSLVKGKMLKTLTLSDYGLLAGTVAKAGKTTLSLQASNMYGSVLKKFTVNSYLPPEITTASLKDATVGKSYKAKLGSKGTKPLTWMMDGKLPNGITFDAAKGLLSGTPTEKGTYRLRFTLSNPAGDIEKSLKLKVNAILPKITGNLKKGSDGKEYKSKLKVKGSEPITVSYSGTLPQGLSFDAATLTFSGIPTEICTGQEIIVKASNIEGETTAKYSIMISGVAPKLSISSLPDGIIGNAYSADLSATGTKPITWSAANLPDGLMIDERTGHISGTSLMSGTFSPVITIKNSIKTVSKKMKLIIASPPVFVENVESTLNEAAVGKAYTHKFKINGTGKITLKQTGGTLPEGIVLSGTTLKGKPKEAGTFAFTLSAANYAGIVSQDFTLTVFDAAMAAKSSGSAVNYTGITAKENAGVPESTGHEAPVYESPTTETYSSSGVSYNGDDYAVVCELSPISVDVSGMYDFSVVLSNDVRESAKLVWLAGSDNPSDDDGIAEFYDDEGAEIETVPESRNITVSAWLNEGRKYQPKIAIKH